MTKFLIANWKMNPSSFNEAKNILDKVLKQNFSNKKIKTVICPPFVWMHGLINFSKNKIEFGAQNVFLKNSGPFTGEISPLMLKNLGIKYVILGHSERRENLFENDEMINLKIKIVLENKLIPVLCIGEKFEIRKKGIDQVKKFILNQIKQDLKNINLKYKNSKIILAYEPIWAISTSGIGTSENPIDASKIIEFIKKEVQKLGFKNNFVLYGGSVNSENILSFLSQKNIDGALVGGASIKLDEFSKMIQILNKKY
ncbi:MAG: triose-phosphate isomerase [Patescibacteria group bacterium]|nr:triose-phosphate isomerase [Patescibacteria group bacterium]